MSAIQFPPLPADTARATESSFGKNHPYLKIGEQLEEVLSVLDGTTLISIDRDLADSFWPYSLATILQCWEDLTDCRMANATRTRLDLKYALHLSLDFPGLAPSALCTFRRRLLLNPPGKQLFQEVVNRLADFVTDRDKYPADADLILSTVCTLSRWEMVVETISNAIEALAASRPEWLRSIALPHWYKRYNQKIPPFHNPRAPKNVKALFLSVGRDGQYLLEAVEQSRLPALMQIREVQMLSQQWQCQFEQQDYQLRLRAASCASCLSELKPRNKS